MRKELTVSSIGLYEEGISLVDKEGNYYFWKTKTKLSPLAYSSKGEWFVVKATVCNEINLKRKALKNVRVISEIRK